MARSFFSLLCLGLVVVMALATPAGAANKEHQQLMADIRMLQEQVQRYQLTIVQLADALKSVNAKLDEQAETSRKLLANEKSVIDAMAGDLRVVREKADDNNVRLGTMAQDVEAISRAIPQMGAAGAAVTPPGGAAGGAPATGTPPPQNQPEQLGALPGQIFQQAQSDYMAGNYDVAIKGFEGYLTNYPKSPQAPDAQMSIGDSLRQQGKFDAAIDAYTKVINNYPGSSKVPEAYFRRGVAYEDAGDKVRARESYQAVIDKYPPDNQWRVMASSRIAKLK